VEGGVKMPIVCERPLIEVLSPEEQHDRLDTAYYLPEFIGAAKFLDHFQYQMTTLGEVMEDDASYGVLPPSSCYCEEGILLVRSSNIANDGVDYENAICVPGEWLTRNRASIKKDDILISIKGARAFFDICVAKDAPPEAIVNGSIFRFHCKPGYNPQFIVLWLLSKPIQSIVFRERSNLGISYIASNVISKIPIPVIKPEDQSTIVTNFESIKYSIRKISDSLQDVTKIAGYFDEVICEILSIRKLPQYHKKVWITKADDIIEQITPRNTDPYLSSARDAVMATSCGFQLLSDVCEVFRGKTPGKLDYEFETESEYKIIKCNNMDWEGKISNFDSVKESWATANLGLCLKKNDLLISCIGTGSIGKVVRWDRETKDIPVSEITVCRPRNEEYSDFLEIFLKSSYGLRQFLHQETGGTGQTHLYPEQIKQIIVPNYNQILWKSGVINCRKALRAYEERKTNFNQIRKIASDQYKKLQFDILLLIDESYVNYKLIEIEGALQ
jgi:hypothetical protein